MKISSAKIIKKLILENELNASELKDKKLLEELIQEQIIHLKRLSTRKAKIILLYKDRLNLFLENKYKIKNLNEYINTINKKEISRSELSKITSNTKSKKTNVQKGIYLNSLENIEIIVDNEKIQVNSILNGSIFINYLSKIEINKDILIVIVENFENLLQIKKQKYLFEIYNKKILFIFRNSAIYEYLKYFENEIIYFGDIDLAGISIYLNEIKSKILNHSSFFIPQNLEELLESANSILYFNQYDKYKNLKSDEKYLENLIALINKYKTTVEQEVLILN